MRYQKQGFLFCVIFHIARTQFTESINRVIALGVDDDVLQTLFTFASKVSQYSQQNWFDNEISSYELKNAYQKAGCCHSESQCTILEIDYIGHTCDSVKKQFQSSDCCGNEDSCIVSMDNWTDTHTISYDICPNDTCRLLITPTYVTKDPIMPLREKAFQCLSDFSKKTPDYGLSKAMRNGKLKWLEYDPTWYCIDDEDLRFLNSEPKNTISAFDFEKILQYYSTSHPVFGGFIERSFWLGFGSVAMHGSGAHNVTGDFDNLSMQLFIWYAIEAFRKAYNQHEILDLGEQVVNITYITDYALSEFRDIIYECKIEGDACEDNTCTLYKRLQELRYDRNIFPYHSSMPDTFEFAIYVWFNLCTRVMFPNIRNDQIYPMYKALFLPLKINIVQQTSGYEDSVLPDLSHLAWNVSYSAQLADIYVEGMSTFFAALVVWLEESYNRHFEWHSACARATVIFAQALDFLYQNSKR